MRAMTFASRNIKEILRDPLSYIFCLGLPIVMLIVMTIVDSSIPASPVIPEGVPIPEGTAMTPTVFQIHKLTPEGIVGPFRRISHKIVCISHEGN